MLSSGKNHKILYYKYVSTDIFSKFMLEIEFNSFLLYLE